MFVLTLPSYVLTPSHCIIYLFGVRSFQASNGRQVQPNLHRKSSLINIPINFLCYFGFYKSYKLSLQRFPVTSGYFHYLSFLNHWYFLFSFYHFSICRRANLILFFFLCQFKNNVNSTALCNTVYSFCSQPLLVLLNILLNTFISFVVVFYPFHLSSATYDNTGQTAAV